MAVRITRDLVCDMCGRDGGTVQRWKITRTADNKSVSPDLCEEHSKCLEDLYDILPAGRRGQTRARRVLTVEELEQTKKAAKRPARKKVK